MNKDEILLVLALVRKNFEEEKRDAQEMYEIFGFLDGSSSTSGFLHGSNIRRQNVTDALARLNWSYPAWFALKKNIGRAVGFFCSRNSDGHENLFHAISQLRFGQRRWSDDDWQQFLEGLRRGHEDEKAKRTHYFSKIVERCRSGNCGMCKLLHTLSEGPIVPCRAFNCPTCQPPSD